MLATDVQSLHCAYDFAAHVRQKVQIREQLIGGSTLCRKGFRLNVVDDITQRAAISRATLDAYFDGKDALLSAIVEQMWVDGHRYYADFGQLPDWSRGAVLTWVR